MEIQNTTNSGPVNMPPSTGQGWIDSAPPVPKDYERPVAKNIPSDISISGRQIFVDGKPFIVKGVGYAPTPLGEDGSQPPYGEYFTSTHSALHDRDLYHLRNMNANTIRIWNWSPTADHTQFLDKCYNNGEKPIYVIAGMWVGGDLSDPSVRANYLDQFRLMIENNMNNPSILMWCFGNEVNYNNSLQKAEWYSLLNEAAALAHSIEGPSRHPVTTANGEVWDAIYNDAAVPNLDVWGINVYRGVGPDPKSSRGKSLFDLFNEYRSGSTKPMILTEFGIDALNNDLVPPQEYELAPPYEPKQAQYAAQEWDEMMANRDISSGGCIMAYSDEWWKDQAGNRYNHDSGGYSNEGPDHFSNEEWYGIMRVNYYIPGQPDVMMPRQIYYTMQKKWEGEPAAAKMSSLTVPWFTDVPKTTFPVQPHPVQK